MLKNKLFGKWGYTVHKAKYTEKYCEANLTGSSTSIYLIETKFVFQLSSIFSVQYSVYLHHKLLTLYPSTKSYTVQHSLYPPLSLHWIHFRVQYVMYLHYIGTSLVHFITTVHHSIIIHYTNELFRQSTTWLPTLPVVTPIFFYCARYFMANMNV